MIDRLIYGRKNKKMKKKLATLLVLAMVLLGSASAVVQPGDDFYYLDSANVLSEEAEGTIYFCNQLLYDACGGQIVVAALDSVGGADTYDYAYELFNDWGIGSAEKNNGFLLLMAIEEDDYFSLPGSGVESIFSSDELGRLQDEYLEPDFAKKDYEAGALKYFEAILDKYIDHYHLNFTYEDGEQKAQAYLAGEGAANSADNRVEANIASHYEEPYEYHPEEEGNFLDGLITTIVVLAVIFIIARAIGGRGRRSGGARPIFFFAPRPPRPPRPPRGPRPPHHEPHRSSPRPPRSGFGGGRGGGGGSFGGGAGRGRH